MTPWTLLERAESAGGASLELLQRGPHFSIRSGGQLLMNSRVHDSEQALAGKALDALGPARAAGARVLVGGLGFGYTLGAVLSRLGPAARVRVVEIAEAVVRWNRERLAELNGHALADRRVEVTLGDVRDVLREGGEAFDVILLDVDNGPRAVGRPGNAWLYAPLGLEAARGSLAAGGVLAIWSAGPEVGFSDRLRRAGFEVALHRVASHAARTGERHFIWVAKKPAAAVTP